MRDRMENFALIPFSFGCNSDSSVAVCTTQLPQKKYKDSSFAVLREKEESERKHCREKSTKKKRALLGFRKPVFSNGLQRLKKSLNCFSHLSVDNKEDEVEEMEMEMEIGFPTDVKHVSHIGLDGSTTINPIPEWKNLKAPHEILSFPSISLKQFELAMAAQSHAHLTTASSGDSKFNSISNFN